MSEPVKRSTVYLDPALHRALRIKAVHTHRSMSDLVNDAVRMAFREDQEDLAAFEERADELTIYLRGASERPSRTWKNIGWSSRGRFPRIYGRCQRGRFLAF